MGSDTLEKPSRPRTLVESFHIYRDKVFDHNRRFKPRSLKPWILIPGLVYNCLGLLWVLVSGAFHLTWTVISTKLGKIRIDIPPPPPPQKHLKIYHVLAATSMGDYLNQVNWAHLGFKIFSRTLLAIYAWIAIALWYNSPWGHGGHWPASSIIEIPYVRSDINSYFNDFDGATVCNIKATDLYAPPLISNEGYSYGYCNSRIALLKALSEGGRHGFDTPYFPNGCHYRWFSIEETCGILDRFDGVVFIGDQNAEMIYAGFNILLRKDLRHGALRPETESEKLASCTCNAQFADPDCHEWLAHSNKEVFSRGNEPNTKSYHCRRTAHAFLGIHQSPASAEILSSFNKLVPRAPPSNYKPIPIIHSLTNDASVEHATSSLDEFLNMADATKRKTPMLWIGPTAAGHIEIKGRKGNQEIWEFARKMARIADDKDVETLGLWNLTVQADSYDGKGFGEGVSIVTAMMVVNWLSRLESS